MSDIIHDHDHSQEVVLSPNNTVVSDNKTSASTESIASFDTTINNIDEDRSHSTQFEDNINNTIVSSNDNNSQYHNGNEHENIGVDANVNDGETNDESLPLVKVRLELLETSQHEYEWQVELEFEEIQTANGQMMTLSNKLSTLKGNAENWTTINKSMYFFV